MNANEISAQTTTTTIVSSELRRGDVVLAAGGLRVLIDGEPRQSRHDDRHGPVTHYNGLVLNRDEVDGAAVPLGWTRVTTGWPEFRPTGEHRWVIQGNDLARWRVERAAAEVQA